MMSRHADQAVLLGAAHAGKRLVAVGERGIALLSDDQGRHWRQVGVPVSVTLTAVAFADEKTGYAVGHGGVVLVTNDGGQTWAKRLDGFQASRIVLEAARDDVSRSNAERLVAEGADKPFLDVHVFDARRAVVVGAYGLVFETRDGGQTWQSWMDRVPNPKWLHIYAIRSLGDTIVLAGEQGLVCRSDDGGATFRRLDTGYKGSFFTAELPSPTEMLVGGLRGNLWRTTDAGASWTHIAVPTPVSLTASARRPDGGVLFFDQAGSAYSVHDGQAIRLGAALPPVNGAISLDDGGLLVLSFKGAVPLPAAVLRAGTEVTR